MHKTISFHLQKGGVGKTTIAGAVACESAMSGVSTLLVDLDPQGNTSSWFYTGSAMYEVADVLRGTCFVWDAVKTVDTIENLYILPSFGIGGELKEYGEQSIQHEPYIIHEMVLQLSQRFDRIILDLSPGLGNLERSALIASDEVITPMTPEIFSLDGLEIFIYELEKLRRNFTTRALHKRVIINGFDGRITQHKDMWRVAVSGPYTMYRLPVDPVFRKSQEHHLPPQMYSERGKGLKTTTKHAIHEIAGEIWS
ncbi:MAG: ParA family protein [Sphaerochaetaceae bacterium]|nr:ParA family protein [Sphaerochaetaceae bacterium]